MATGAQDDDAADARLNRARERGPVRAPWLDEPSQPNDAAAQRLGQWARGLRWDIGARGVAALALVGITVLVVAAVVVFRDRPQPYAVPPLPPDHEPVASTSILTDTGDAAPDPTETTTLAADLVVSVVGMVARPGVLRLAPGSRVSDALTAAGGALPGADLVNLNMAARLTDGDQVLVGSAAAAPVNQSSAVHSGSTAPPPGSPPSQSRPPQKVNLNTATEQDLDQLPGIGPATAAAILAWRQANGHFTTLDQLREIHGIGPTKLAHLRPWITL